MYTHSFFMNLSFLASKSLPQLGPNVSISGGARRRPLHAVVELEAYLRAVRQLAQHYHKSPDLVTEEELRQYFLYIRNVKKYARPTTTIARLMRGSQPKPSVKWIRLLSETVTKVQGVSSVPA
jgi:Phage integrase, N-terminal SAM-like domain